MSCVVYDTLNSDVALDRCKVIVTPSSPSTARKFRLPSSKAGVCATPLLASEQHSSAAAITPRGAITVTRLRVKLDTKPAK